MRIKYFLMCLLSSFLFHMAVAQKKSKGPESKKTEPQAQMSPAEMEASRLIDSCAEIFAAGIDNWARHMSLRSDIITNFTGCGSPDCRQSKFGELNTLLSDMSYNMNYNIYGVLYKNDSRLHTCEDFGKMLSDAKWKFSSAGNKYESAATFAINLKKDYNSYSTDQRARFIKEMFDAYDEADVSAQEGMKGLMDAYELYLAGKCRPLKPGTTFNDGNIIYKSLANAQAFLKIKLEQADKQQQQNTAANEKKKKQAEAAAKKNSEAAAANETAAVTKCKCCKGKGYTSKQVGEFHKMSEKRVERTKKIENGKVETEVTYEPIGYTKYKTVKETCSCCNGSGKE